MIARLAPVVAVALFCICGCSQSTAPPIGAAQAAGAFGATRSHANQGQLEYFNTPSKGAWPGYISVGPQKALWFSEEFTSSIGRIADDGTITEFAISNGEEPEGITEGGDGNIWFTEPGANAIGRMTPQGASTIFSIDGSDPDPRGITLGPDGNVWFTEWTDGYIDRITPSGTITRFEVPGYSPEPWAITAGPDGDLWFTESEANAIGRFDPRTLKFEPSLSAPTAESTPWGILFAPDKHIWFTERTGDKIAEVMGVKHIREFKIAQEASYPEALTPGPDGDLWFTESQAQDIGRIDLRTGRFRPIITLPTGDIPNGIATGAHKNVLFTIDDYTGPSQIGEVLRR
jgi:virginiamycin B lyase